jgi:hypothetical protein
VSFHSGAGLYRGHFPLDTVANVVELWAWTGEFVAACTRRGKMPVLYQSYGLPGGIERGKRYAGKRFHDDLAIKAIPSGLLGKAYLDHIERMLGSLQKTQMPRIRQAAEWWKQLPRESSMTLVTGHMFPHHAQDPRSPRVSEFGTAADWENRDLTKEPHAPRWLLYLGYQFAPEKLLQQAKQLDVKLVYSVVRPTQPPEPAANVLYIDPGWPLADGCVEVPGYDVPILPASGVMQAAILWTLAAERGD